MTSLYAPEITNEQLLNQFNLRHRKINFDFQYTSRFLHDNINLLKNVSWSTFSFNKQNVAALSNEQGIYMFTFNPYSFSFLNHDADIVLYIGQAGNLKERLSRYFHYPNSRNPSDQQKRFMILFFSDYLKIHVYQTRNWNKSDLDTLEYSLIDSILPPFNQKIESKFAQEYRKLISN